jgi:cytochrome c-type biogenesis protein CcmF
MRVTPPLFAGLYLLMGIAPLSAWGATSLSRLGRALLVPLLLTVVFVVLFALGGMSSPGALFAYGLISLAGFVALYEIYRGAAARHRGLGESWLRAITALFGRNRRRYGGYIIHLGVTIIGIGVIGSTLFQSETQQTIARGDTLSINDYQLRYDDFTEAIATDGRTMQIADVTVLRNGQEIAQLRPRIDVYPQQPTTIAGAYSTLENDFYVLLVGWEEVGYERATFKVFINPLINLVWWGGLILILGTFIAAWPVEAAVRVRSESRRDERVGATV